MKVTLKTFADYRDITGIREKQLEIEECLNMGGLLNRLTDAYPGLRRAMFKESGGLREFVILMVNGRNIEFLDKMDTRLGEGDVIALFPPVAGG